MVFAGSQLGKVWLGLSPARSRVDDQEGWARDNSGSLDTLKIEFSRQGKMVYSDFGAKSQGGLG